MPPSDRPPPPTTDTPRPRSIISQHFPKFAIWTATSLSSPGVNSFSGAMAGMASGIVTCPLDVIKTKLQNQSRLSKQALEAGRPLPPPLYKGLVGTARVVIRQDGLSGLYRGLGAMLLGYLPTWAVYMAVYDSSREYLYANGYGEREKDKWFARIYASLAAGFCSTTVTNPIWVIKTRLMSQTSKGAAEDGVKQSKFHYTGTFDAARQMYREEGFKVYYAGLAPALLGLTHVAIQFPLYEYFKQTFTGSEMGAAQNPQSPTDAASNTFGILAATFLSKICATSATYPHEVIRTRIQTQTRFAAVENGSNGVGYSNHSEMIGTARKFGSTDGMAYQPKYTTIAKTFKTILREEGAVAFYNGMGTNMIRAIPAAMTTMLAFESIKGFVGRLQEEGRELRDEYE